MIDRSASFQSQQHRDRVRRQARRVGAVDFFNMLTGAELLEKTEAYLPEHRERLYPPTVTLSMFMKQALNEDRSCQKAVNGWAAQRAAEALSVHSVRTGGYCQARQRLPTEMVVALTRETGGLLSNPAPRCWRWRGRRVKLVDGTGISMPDTPQNQARYPQLRRQRAGVGFPLARLVALICLSTGAVLDAAIGPFEGKGHSERDLLRALLAGLCAEDVLMGDAYFCSYFLIATLQQVGVDVLFEQNGARKSDFRRGQRLGERDHLVYWSKPKTKPQWMTHEQYATFPDQMMVRETQAQGRVLVTTLLNARKVSKGELSNLYMQRWQVELDLRNIKTTLGMEVLSCLSPQMVEKELWVYLLAYNVIRLLMAHAAHHAGMHPRELSFKHTVQMWSEWTCRTLRTHPTRSAEFFRLIAQLTVGDRPGRVEPRARKRRPKSYPWLKVPRAEARRQIRIHGHLLCA